MAHLRAAQVPSHTLAAELLLLNVLGCDRAWLYAHSEDRLDSVGAERYFALISRRAAGEPTQYLTGKQEFWGLEFEVTPAVLIPRPETEHLVEVALERLGPRGIKIDRATGEPSRPLYIADVGTGSGCLAVALARELPHAEVCATDISPAALEVARRNSARHGVSDRIHFIKTDLLEAWLHSPLAADRGLTVGKSKRPVVFDLIVSNPPYLARDGVGALQREVREHEPESALIGGASGIEMYARLSEQAARLLAPQGIFVVELGYGAADKVLKILQLQRKWVNISITNDLAEIPRVLAAERG